MDAYPEGTGSYRIVQSRHAHAVMSPPRPRARTRSSARAMHRASRWLSPAPTRRSRASRGRGAVT